MASGGGYEAVMEKLNQERVPQDDPMLINMIRKHFIEPPSTLPYNLNKPKKSDFSPGISKIFDINLNQMVSHVLWYLI